MEPIAIVGIGCRFPGGAHDPGSFWELLCSGRDAFTDVPPDRWDLRIWYDPDPAKPCKMPIRQGAFLSHPLDRLDARFFGISPREAAALDPQQRILLETAWESFEDAGIAPESLAGSDTGVFVGAFTRDAFELFVSFSPQLLDTHTGIDTALSALAGRLAYTFDLRGPALTIDTACSSSLVALHYACLSLAAGECSVALAGGVNVVLSPLTAVALAKAGLLSPDSRSRAFDARADGYARGEGVGLVVLKSLSAALADQDDIYAVVRGSAVNQDGRTQGMSVPSGPAQIAAIREAHRRAGTSPGQVVYIEAHGTGTPVGDPIEANAMGTALAEGRAPHRPCIVGSVKTNIGHLEGAAGIAGLIKTALCLKNRRIPPLLHLQEPNPAIPFDALGLRLARQLQPWPDQSGEGLAGVNSFGFTGTNAHAVLGPAPEALQPGPPRLTPERPLLLPVSARDEAALHELAQSYLAFVSPGGRGAGVPLEDLCHSAAQRRGHHPHRAALVFEGREELIEKLHALERGEPGPAVSRGKALPGRRPRILFVFTGMGPQWWAMGRELLTHEPVFREAVERCDALFREVAGWSPLDELLADEKHSRMQRTEVAQTANFAVQYALAALWRSWGVVPDAIVGHSVGEVAAACVSGALSFEDSVLVSYHRARLQATTAGMGGMLAVGLGAEQAHELAGGSEGRVSVAAVNSSSTVTLTGDAAALAEIAAVLQEQRVFHRPLQVEVPYHSPLLDGLREPLVAALIALQPKTPAVPLISTVTGARVEGALLDGGYWWRNVRDTVRFHEAIHALAVGPDDVFLEIGPHPVLTSAIVECLAERQLRAEVIPSLYRGRLERRTMLTGLGRLYVRGCPVDWNGLDRGGEKFVRLPAYPWQRERYWAEAADALERRVGSDRHPLLASSVAAPQPTWQADLDSQIFLFLRDHAVDGTIVLPGACYVEAALAAAGQAFGDVPCELEDVRFERVLVLDPRHGALLRTSYDAEEHTYAIHSAAVGDPTIWTLHSTGKLHRLTDAAVGPRLELGAIRARCSGELDARRIYARAAELGYGYGPAFQGLERIWRGPDAETLGRLQTPSVLQRGLGRYRLHPAVLDSALQLLLADALFSDDTEAVEAGLFLPVFVRRVRFYPAAGTAAWSRGRITHRGSRAFEAELAVLDETGRVLVQLEGIRAQKVPGTMAQAPDPSKEWLYELRWERGAHSQSCAELLVSPLEAAGRLTASVPRLLGRPEWLELERMETELSTAYIAEALRKLGWDARPGQRFSAESVAAELGVVPHYRRLLERMFDILADSDIVSRTPEGWCLEREPPEIDAELLFDAMCTRFPRDKGELIALADCGPALAQVLRGSANPIDLMFPGGSLSLVEAMYHPQRLQLFHELVGTAVQTLIERVPKDRRIRVLEIGAGTGATTAAVLPVLPADRTQYVFTDVSAFFGVKAAEKLRPYPFVEHRVLDIERDPAEQGFEPQQYDLVLAANVLHATADLRRTLLHARSLLAPGGQLVLLELTMASAPIDLSFGLLPDWWKFSDTHLRPDHALLPAPAWRELLADVGFVQTAALPETREPGRGLRLSVLLAQAPAAEIDFRRPDRESGTWLLFEDQSGAASQLAGRLLARGDRVLLGDRADLERWVQRARASGDCRGVIYFWSGEPALPVSVEADTLERAGLADCDAAVRLVQTLTTGDPGAAPPRLWLVTTGARQLAGQQTPASPAQATLWGLGSTIETEHPETRCTLVDLDPDDAERSLPLLLDELDADGSEPQIAFRGHQRFLARLARMDSLPPAAAPEAEGSLVQLHAETPGNLENLAFRQLARRKLAPDEVEIRVQAAALNFKDLMFALGMLEEPGTDSYMGSALGFECSGTVVALGSDVRGLAAGDEVIALAQHSLASYTVAPAFSVVRKPKHLSFAQAATLLIPFLTAVHSLKEAARLRRGESVLIHAAAGGVGLAAIQVAAWLGARVLATAGSDEKRDFLRSLGVEHVSDSRSTAFADDVLRWTGGRGVDVVLNSLQGELFGKNLTALAPFGRLIEIGRRDIERGARMDLGPFRKALSFVMVDLDRMMAERQDECVELLRQVAGLLEDGTFTSLPVEVFPAREVVQAFRHMARARHIGRIAVSFEEGQIPPAAAQPRPLCRDDATYLITGGLGGFGLATARWLVGEGARHLVLLGRSGAATSEAREAVESLQAQGVEVRVACADVANTAQLDSLLAECASTMPPLRGVVHAAMVLDDELVARQDRQRFRNAMEPKVLGAWNLHVLTRGLPLELFVCYSSAAALLGHEGQSNYCAANAFLVALAHHRQAIGFPGLAVDWGPIADAGYVARHEDVAKNIQRAGVRLMPAASALDALGRLLRAGVAHGQVTDVDWRHMAEANPHAARSPQLVRQIQADPSAQASEAAPTAAPSLRTLVLEADPESKRRQLVEYLRERAARILGSTPAQIDVELPLSSHGWDSLMAAELKADIASDVRVNIPVVRLAQGISILGLAALVVDQLTTGQVPQAAPGREGTPERDAVQ
jgi:acyl transferase domain-containing protein/NADPH:quinone reductase-like Zn-dependent oxidoreductase/SAM-dependent methyltransferase